MGDKHMGGKGVRPSCCRLWSSPYWWWPRIVEVGVGDMSAGATHTDEVCWGVKVNELIKYVELLRYDVQHKEVV